MIWFALFPAVVAAYWFFISFPFSLDLIYLLCLIPLFFVLYCISLISSLISVKVAIWIVHKRIAPPSPGSYSLSMDEPQVRAWVLKGNIKNFARWLFLFFHFSFLQAFWLRQMGVKIGHHVKLGKHVQDDDFIEIGSNTYMAKECIISGHLMDQTHLTINPTTIGANCIFEPITGAVGCVIGDNSIFKSCTMAMKGNNCRGNSIYEGLPIKKVGNYSDLTPAELRELKQKIRQLDKVDYVKLKNAPIKVNRIKLFLLKFMIILGATIFGFISPLLYTLFFTAFYQPSNHLLNIILLIPVPGFFLIALGLFTFGEVLLIKLCLIYYDHKAEIPEGTYDLNDPRVKLFKIKYILRMFGMRLFHATPFKIGSTLALRAWGNTKIGKINVKLEDAIVDPQYIEIGNHTQIAAGARIHTHDIINGKLVIKKVKIGSNVIVGSYAHIKPGVEIADGSIVAVGACLPQDQKCTCSAVLLGNPAKEYPLSILTKAARLEGKYID
ncbi:MAG: hypothetical protein ACTSRS_17970 [Candidatus Helarchaeota archaeon]